MKGHGDPRGAGFTLTEILVAIIILAICVLGIMPLIVVATRSHKTSVENSIATSIAKLKMAELQESLDNSNPLGRKIIQDIKKSNKNPKVAVLAPQTIPGFPPQYKVGVEVSELTPQDVSQSGYYAKIRVRWLPDGVADKDDDIGRIWTFQSVLMKKSDHRDFIDSQVNAAPPPPPSRPAAFDPVMEWAGEAATRLPEAQFKPPDDKLMLQYVLDAMSKNAKPWAGQWETALQQKGTKGVALFQKQPVTGVKDSSGRHVWAMNGLMTYFPHSSTGLKNPRLLQIAKRDVYIDDKPSDINGHPFMLDGGTSAEDPFFKNQKALSKDKDPEFADMGDSGVVAWASPALANPWSMAKNFELRIAWTLYSWVVAKDAEGNDVALGYFSWRAVLEGKIGIGPTDTEIKPRIEVVTFIEADGKSGQGADHILQKALQKK